MATSPSRRKKLDLLMRSIAKGDFPSARQVLRDACQAAAAPPARPLELQVACPGREIRALTPAGEGRYWLVRRTLTEVAPQHLAVAGRYAAVLRGAQQRFDELKASAALCHAANSRPEDLLFVDIETCGLSAAAIFLIGVMTFRDGQLTFDQLLARDYAEEAAILHAFAKRYDHAGVLVSFNGKAFDMNMIHQRIVYHALAPPDRHPPHLDLLHEARRRWRGRLPNCRLQTLEQCLCGRHRTDDIPGSAIPDAYHRFVHTRDARRIADILRHNLLDMLTMAELVCLILTGSDPASSMG